MVNHSAELSVCGKSTVETDQGLVQSVLHHSDLFLYDNVLSLTHVNSGEGNKEGGGGRGEREREREREKRLPEGCPCAFLMS